jgi:hypothetical protein
MASLLVTKKIKIYNTHQSRNSSVVEHEVINLDDIKVEDSTASSASKREMTWNAVAVQNLFESYRKARREISNFPPKSRPTLSALVHANFTRLQPNCKLVPTVLMAKLFSLKSSKSFVETPAPVTSSPDVKMEEEEVEDSPGIDTEGSSKKSKNLIFRTWCQFFTRLLFFLIDAQSK